MTMIGAEGPTPPHRIVGQLSLRDLLTVVFRRRWLIVIFAVSVLVVVTLVAALQPPVYEVESTLLVNKSRAEVPIAAKESPQLIVSQVSEQELNSEIEILKSRQLLEEVIDELNLEELPQQETWLTNVKSRIKSSLRIEELPLRDRLIMQLEEGLTIEAVRRSNVIRLSYRAEDPELATQVVRALADHYLSRRAQMYQSPQALEFFEEQMDAAEVMLGEREAALESVLAAAGITMVKGPQGTDALATHKGLLMQRLARIQDELAGAEVEMKESQYRVLNLQRTLAGEPERRQSANRFNQDAAREEIEKGIAGLELERDRLVQDFKPDSRFVRDIDTQIALAEQRLEDLDVEGGNIDGTEVNPIHQELKTELLRAEAELEGAQGAVLSLQHQESAVRHELEALNQKAFELERLRREAQAAEESYLLYRKKHEEARISAAMDQEKLINVSVAQPARPPLRPLSRRLALNMFLAGVIGVLGGLGIAFAIEYYLDHTFTTGEEMERRLGLAHLASIPEEV
jgi:uncharacterized protein involved in exopolysaccharide biosynthesis